jgi:hypothetical protein
MPPYRITSSAVANSVSGMVRPSALAVLSFAAFQFGVFPSLRHTASTVYSARKPHDIMTTKTIDQPARRLRPLLRWAERLLTLVRDALPSPGYIYVEPFCGSAYLFFQTSPQRAVLADINLDPKKDRGGFAQVPILSTQVLLSGFDDVLPCDLLCLV